MKVIVCEKCFHIPKITIANKNQIQLECQNCNSNISSDINYFNKFIKVNENDDLFTLPNCNFKNHQVKSIIYCFKCGKYLCNDCLNNHNEIFQGNGHITIKQKIYHQYFCEKKDHKENILNRFCLKCNNYLCYNCKCEHNEKDMYIFNNIENEINEIKNNILKCEETIKKEEINYNNFIKKLEEKIKILKNLFDDYKKRNSDLISFYKLLIDNYKQIKNIKNYNIRNNIFLNNNFDLRNSQTYPEECLISEFNRLSEFYRNTNHIKTQEFIDHCVTPKYCNSKIKKCCILDDNITIFILKKEHYKHYIHFVYKNKNNENKLMKKYYDNSIQNIYPLINNKFIYLDGNNKLFLTKIKIENLLQCSTLFSLENIQFVILDLFNKENFFTISNSTTREFFILQYYLTLENKNNMYLILKEYKAFDNRLIDSIKKIINNSTINGQDKNNLISIFNNEVNIKKLIESNNKLLKFIDTMNINIYNKINEKIKINENKYVINSNYIMKYLSKFNKDNLNQNELNEVNYICKVNKLCNEIMDKYLNYLIFNSKINNIYNYQNKFLLFMGEHYLFFAFSLKAKKFFGLESANLIKNNNYNNFEIMHIYSNKIFVNNIENKIINIIENDNTYNFCLIKNSFNYYSNALAENDYLLIDNIKNNNLIFTLINLDDYSIKQNFEYDFGNVLNFKIDNNPPKIYLTKNFKKFIYSYEDDNQLVISNLKLNKPLEQKDNKEINYKINLKKDNNSEIIPSIHDYSSLYDKDYGPEKLSNEKGYFCTRGNNNEYITFKFDKEYWFLKISITIPDKYQKAGLKEFKINYYDNQGIFIKNKVYKNDNSKLKEFSIINIDEKAAYIKLEFLANFGEDYFCIERIKFFAEITHSFI